MNWLNFGASFLSRALRRCAAALATSAARHSAELAPGARFLSGGSISNIAGRSECISVGTGSRIAGQLLVFRHGGAIRIGEWCYVGEGSRIWSARRVDIGNRVLISHGVNIHDCDSHSLDPEARHRQFRAIAVSGHPQEIDNIDSSAIEIEDDVWIGFNATVLKGSHIGARTIVAAGSIVMGAVPADSLYIGTEVKRNIDANDRRK